MSHLTYENLKHGDILIEEDVDVEVEYIPQGIDGFDSEYFGGIYYYVYQVKEIKGEKYLVDVNGSKKSNLTKLNEISLESFYKIVYPEIHDGLLCFENEYIKAVKTENKNQFFEIPEHLISVYNWDELPTSANYIINDFLFKTKSSQLIECRHAKNDNFIYLTSEKTKTIKETLENVKRNIKKTS